MYTLNDNVCGYVTDTLIEAHRVYREDKYKAAIQRLDNFLLRAQIPDPQSGWARQYNYNMQPIWARKFEPPGISDDETQEVLETLLKIARFTNNRKYLKPMHELTNSSNSSSWLSEAIKQSLSNLFPN